MFAMSYDPKSLLAGRSAPWESPGHRAWRHLGACADKWCLRVVRRQLALLVFQPCIRSPRVIELSRPRLRGLRHLAMELSAAASDR